MVLLAWITAGLFGLLFLVHAGRLSAACCKGRRKGEDDVEKAGIRPRDRSSAAVELGNEVRNRPYMAGRGGGSGRGAAGNPANYLGGGSTI